MPVMADQLSENISDLPRCKEKLSLRLGGLAGLMRENIPHLTWEVPTWPALLKHYQCLQEVRLSLLVAWLANFARHHLEQYKRENGTDTYLILLAADILI